VVSQQNADIVDTLQLKDVAMATIFLAFNIWGAHGRQLTNTSEPSGDAALCQITLTTCQNYMYYHMLNSVLSVAAQLQHANFCALLCVLVIMLKKTITRFCCLLHASTRWMD